jgi:hypothetical protein
MKAFPLKELSDFQKLAGASAGVNALSLPDLFKSPGTAPSIQRQHSLLVDRILGIDMSFERRLANSAGRARHWQHAGVKTWVGLDPQTLNTPYSVLREICLELQLTRERVVDLGSGVGRLGLVLQQLAPAVSFLGQEYVGERVDEANRAYLRWGCQAMRCERADLLSENYVLPEADVYFIYDFGDESALRRTLQRLSERAAGRALRVVGRGALITKLLGEPAGATGHRVVTLVGRQKTPAPLPAPIEAMIGA